VGKAKALYEVDEVGNWDSRAFPSSDERRIPSLCVPYQQDAGYLQYCCLPCLACSIQVSVDTDHEKIALRKSALACWDKHYSNEGVDFEMLFQDVLASSKARQKSSCSSVSRTSSSAR
jgi:hypothetical protein